MLIKSLKEGKYKVKMEQKHLVCMFKDEVVGFSMAGQKARI
jgi:hypothetical protein